MRMVMREFRHKTTRLQRLLLPSGARGGPRIVRSAFTLIELLATLAIVTLLVALLFPLAGKMRAKAAEAACLSNLRQVASGLLLYAADHDNRFPPYYSDANDPAHTHWQYVVGTQYLGEPDLDSGYNDERTIRRSPMHCPADTTKSPLSPPPRLVRNVAMNGSMNPGHIHWPKAQGACYRKLASIGNPSKLCLIADGQSGAFSNEWGYAARLTGLVTSNAEQLSKAARHRGGLNCAMTDGHVEWHPSTWILQESYRDHNYNDSLFFDTAITH